MSWVTVIYLVKKRLIVGVLVQVRIEKSANKRANRDVQ